VANWALTDCGGGFNFSSFGSPRCEP
jgi:hypothetical protein